MAKLLANDLNLKVTFNVRAIKPKQPALSHVVTNKREFYSFVAVIIYFKMLTPCVVFLSSSILAWVDCFVVSYSTEDKDFLARYNIKWWYTCKPIWCVYLKTRKILTGHYQHRIHPERSYKYKVAQGCERNDRNLAASIPWLWLK